MNATALSTPAADARPATHTFRLLLRREFWENRGGFFWAPVIAGGIAVLFGILGAITGAISMRGDDVDFDLRGDVPPDFIMHFFGTVADLNLIGGIGLSLVVMVFVLFFYCLGALYDERKDRSVLFWKSLPVSDTQTVMAKVAWAVVLSPLVSVAIGILIGVCMWLISALMFAASGQPAAMSGFTHSHPFSILLDMLTGMSVYPLWALPTIGWLMLCSAWARSKPFLWAVLIPVLAGAIISWMDTLPGIDIPHDKVWYILGLRGLLSIVPGTWLANEQVFGAMEQPEDIDGPAHVLDILGSASPQAFATPDLWIGAGLGAAMIYGAIRLRRWRDEG
jgi:ABC-2 type transport system permease protein